MSKAEFDQYAKSYRDVHQANISITGETPEYFATYKIRDFRGHVARAGLPLAGSYLDFGCGTGNSIAPFLREFPEARLTCADVSSASLEVARLAHGDRVDYEWLGEEARADSDTAQPRFDGAFANCVFHHIPHAEHGSALALLRERLRPGGLLMIYEHNPLNPLTVHAVNTCPLDENAVLISAKAWPSLLASQGFGDIAIDYRVFFPARLAALRRLENRLRWLPLGAQYCVTARRR